CCIHYYSSSFRKEEADMKRIVYAVLFKSGVLKVGSAKNVITTVKGITAGGKSFGHDMATLFFTEPHEDAEKNERKVIAYCKQYSKSSAAGCFVDADYALAREAMLTTG